MELSNITLAWMMSQLEGLLDFNKEFILRQDRMNREYYVDTRQEIRPWSFGTLWARNPTVAVPVQAKLY